MNLFCGKNGHLDPMHSLQSSYPVHPNAEGDILTPRASSAVAHAESIDSTAFLLQQRGPPISDILDNAEDVHPLHCPHRLPLDIGPVRVIMLR